MRKRALTAVWLLVLACQTAGAQQNTTLITRERLLLAVDRLLADRWYPPGVKPPPPITPDDQGMLNAALISGNPELQQIAIRSLGRFEDPALLPAIAPFLNHEAPAIRVAAWWAVGMALSAAETATPSDVEQALEARLLADSDWNVHATILRVMGHLLYDPVTVLKVQKKLACEVPFPASRGTPVGCPRAASLPSSRGGAPPAPGVRPAARGPGESAGRPAGPGNPAIEALAELIHRHRTAPFTPEARHALVTLAMPTPPATPDDTALEALIDANAGTFAIANRAARFRCPVGSVLCGEDIRRLGVRMMDAGDPAMLIEIQNAVRDVSPLVRAEALRKLAESPESQFMCLPSLEAIAQSSDDTAREDQRIPSLLLEIDALSPKCAEHERATDLLELFTRDLSDPLKQRRWQVPARALEKLAEFAPEKADNIIDKTALAHEVWQVRAAAARTARITTTTRFLVALAEDPEPNVRSEAITALARLHAPGTTEAALKALESGDHQLLIVACRALAKTSQPREARDALLAALKRVTAAAADTSRAARLEMFRRLKDYSVPNEDGISLLSEVAEELSHYLKDFDPLLARAAADLLTIVSRTEVSPQPTYRPPAQPDEVDLLELTTLPFVEDVRMSPPFPSYKADAIIELSDGKTLSLRLARDDAPVAVARFLKLARNGYYNGQTFYHFEPYRVVVGGSPASNDYSGDARFWRDEIVPSARNSPGAVGLATNGRDTVDGRFFIDLTRLPEFDWEFTILARVVATNRRLPIDLSPVLEGTTIARVIVPPKQR